MMKYRLLYILLLPPNCAFTHPSNHDGGIMQQRGEDWIIDRQPLKVFEMPERDEGEWNDLPLYKNEVDGGDSEVVYDKQ